MEGEIVFYDQPDLEAWKPREYVPLDEDTISPLGQLYAAWNAVQRRTIDEYDRRRRVIDDYHKEVICPPRNPNADARARRRSRRTFATAFITDSCANTDAGARGLQNRGSPS